MKLYYCTAAVWEREKRSVLKCKRKGCGMCHGPRRTNGRSDQVMKRRSCYSGQPFTRHPSSLCPPPIKASLLPDAESLQTPSASSLPLCSTHLSLCQSIPPSLPPAPLQITATSSPPFLVLPSSEFPLLSFSSLARTPGMWLEQRDDIVGEDGRETGSVQDQCSQIWMWKLSIFTAWFLMLLGNNFKILSTKLNEKFKNIFFLGGGSFAIISTGWVSSHVYNQYFYIIKDYIFFSGLEELKGS